MNEQPTNSEPVDSETVDSETVNQGITNSKLENLNIALVRERLNRRSFLGGMLSSATALLAVACGRDAATPTPTPCPTGTPTPISRSSILPSPTSIGAEHQVYLPAVYNEAGEVIPAAPTAEATLAPSDTPTPVVTEEPTLTPTPPKPTDTPRPTATPTPSMTPFPNGPASKLGFVVERNDPQLFKLLETGGVAVVSTLELDVDFAAQIKKSSPRTWLIGRLPHLEQIELRSLDPVSAARTFVEQLLPIANDPQRRNSFDGWQAYNEPVPGNADEMKRLAEFEAERTRLLAEKGIRSVIGNFGTGQPPLEQWEHFLPAVQAAKEYNGWLALHEYSAPTIYHQSTRENQGRYPGVSATDTGWLTLRYRQVYNQILKPANLVIPLVFTEIGVDGFVGNRPGPADARGWQDFQQYWAENGYGLWGPGAYVEQLVWFDEAMRQDNYVIGGCIFTLAGSNNWKSYDILGPAAGILEQYLSVHKAV